VPIVRGAHQDRNVRCALAHRSHDGDGVPVIREAHHHQPRPGDAERMQQCRPACVAVEHPLTTEQRFLHAHRVLVHGHELDSFARQDAAHRLPDPTVPTHDHVAGEFCRRVAHADQVCLRLRRAMTMPQQ
jgi:hypothetical protein